MYIWLILALLFTVLEAIAVAKNIRKLEYVAKPAVMVCLFLWLYTTTGLQGDTLWFGIGILFSLAGDVLLMLSLERLFLFGLIAFLLAHVAYIIGFRNEFAVANALTLLLLVFIAISVRRLIRRIVDAMQQKGEKKLIVPVILYGTVISIMLFAAMSTIFDPIWSTRAAFFVSMGALLFCASDVILAWNRFVAPIRNGRVINIALYHLGQIGIIAGIISLLS
jgi:uncharacterized membrane protein YhhN